LRSCTGENRGNTEFLAMGASLLCGAFAVHQMVSRCWAPPSTEGSSPASVCSVSSCSLLNGSPVRDSDFLGARNSFRLNARIGQRRSVFAQTRPVLNQAD